MKWFVSLRGFVQEEDSSYFVDDGWVLLAEVPGGYEQLRNRAVEVRAFIRDDAVAAAGPGWVVPIGDD